MSNYSVVKYSVSELSGLFNKYSHGGLGYSEGKSHLSYFDEYLEFIDTKTILVEHPYTDRDYLEDYAAYYARCHAPYERRCARIHFFSSNFDGGLIAKILARDDEAVTLLRNSYLGFMVAKPLPSTVIGRTCLITYGNKNRDRSFPATRTYKVHLLGLELEVRSLPFQEQDTDVAACATSALWSVFNVTGHLFQHSIPSPAEITKAATASQRAVSRTLPALNGLSAEQIADAIRSVGLEPLYISANNLQLLLVSASAYLRAGIPSLLLGAIIQQAANSDPIAIGLHAIALGGFSLPKAPSRPYGAKSATLFRGSSIERLYAHDDQVGPFSRISVNSNGSLLLGTSWQDENKKRGNLFFEPRILLVPLYHKIRVPITSVISTIVALDDWLEAARAGKVLPVSERLEWDISLIEVADLKKSVYAELDLVSGFREDILQHDMPRYIWRVRATSKDAKLFDILFDATDLLQGGHVISVLPYSKDVCVTLCALATNSAVVNYIKSSGNRGVEMTLKWFADNKKSFQ